MPIVYSDKEEEEKATSVEITFYSRTEADTSSPLPLVTYKKRFSFKPVKTISASNLLSASEIARISNGMTFLGWKFYRWSGTSNTSVPGNVHVNASSGYITRFETSPDRLDIVGEWGIRYRVNHFLQNTDGSTYPSSPFRTESLAALIGENTNAHRLTGSDIAGFTYDSSASDSLVQSVAEDGSTVINLYYTRNMIYLTLNKNGGNIGGNSSDITIRGRYGASTASAIAEALPSNPVQTGKVFAGWEPPLPETFPASGTSYSVVWASKLYNIAFNSNGGSGSMATHTNRVYETEYTLPANTFTKATSDGTAYQFYGWNTQADGNGASYAGGASVSGSIFESGGTAIENGDTVTLYAQWKAPYKVNHKFEEKHSGGGSPRYYTRRTEIKHAVPGENTAAEALSADDELMPGYELSGTISQQPVSADGTTAIDINYSLKQITLTFNLNGGNIGGDTSKTANVTETGYYNYTNIIKAGTQDGETLASGWQDDVEWEGRIFSGWLDSETGGVITTLPEKFPPADKTYTAQWDAETYTLTFVTNGGTWGSGYTAPESYTVESTVTLPVSTDTTKNILKNGYNFAGWYDNEGLTGDAVTTTAGASGAKTYYAKWTPVTYTITYNLDGGTNSSLNPATYTIETSDITLRNAGHAGYEFGGWFTDSTFTESSKVTIIPQGSYGNITLYAKFTAISYDITYETNGGTWKAGYTAPGSYTVESLATLPIGTPVASAEITKTGYTFAGWYQNSGLTGDAVTTTIGTTGAKTYYAKWTPVTYTITYNLDGGTNSSENPATYTIEDADITLADATPSTDDYGFGGWYTTSTFANSSKVTEIPHGSTGNKTLYVKWLPIYATVNGTKYYTLNTAKTAIQETEGEVNVVLYSAAQIGKSSDESSITYAIRNPHENCTEIHVSIASGEHVTVKGADAYQGFQNCTKLVSVDLDGLESSSLQPCTSLNCFFAGCSALTSVNFNFTTFDSSNLKAIGQLFYGCSSLTTIDLTGINTSNVDGQPYAGNYAICGFIEMFMGCTNLTSIIGLNEFDTSKSRCFRGMFNGCSSLTSLDLSNFVTSNVEEMDYMFYKCTNLASVNVSSFNTSKVKLFTYMFYQCSSLTTLDLSSFSNDSATNIQSAFQNCTNLTTIYATTNFDCSSVTNKNGTFTDCTNLHGGAGTTYSFSRATGVYARIDGGTSNPGYFTGRSNYAKVGSTYYNDKDSTIAAITDSSLAGKTITVTLFGDLTQTDIGSSSSDNTIANAIKNTTANAVKLVIDANAQITIGNASGMFKNCTKLIYADLRGFNTQTTENMYQMFYGCTSLTELDLSSFNTASVSSMDSCFENCGALRTIYASNSFEAPSSTNVFKGCTSLVGGAGTTYNSSITGNLYARIDDPDNNEAGYFTAKP